MKTTKLSGIIILVVLTISTLYSQPLYIRIDDQFYSQSLDQLKMIDVFVPANYYDNPDQEYAVIYYLHGGGGNQNSSNNYAHHYYTLHNQNPNITSPPAIFVGPDGSCPPYLGSDYVNSELYGNYEDFIIQDVISYIEQNYRAIPHKNFRLITGTSMGGFGTANLSTRHPEKFRAAFPYIGFPAIPDTLLETWKELYYLENGNYIPNYGTGINTNLLLTMAGGLSPNMNNPPYYVDFPFDTAGVWVDSVLQRWYEHDASRKVKDLPSEHELAWFLGCGTTDYMCTYPAYLQLADSLDFYGIGYSTHFFNGGHIFYLPAWTDGVNWMDSIINHSFLTVDITNPGKTQNHLSIYPNPVSDIINISFQIEEPGILNITLYDQHGRQVAIISASYREKGAHKIAWQLSAQPAGVYFIRMKTVSDVNTTMILKH